MRTLGVTSVGLYQILRGVVGLVFGLFVVFYDGPANKLVSVAAVGNPVERLVGHFGHGAGLIIIAFAVVHIVAAYGVLRMQNWGRILILLFSAIELVLVLPGTLQTNVFSLLVGGLNAICIFYLAMPRINRAFHAEQLGGDGVSGSTARA